MALTLALDLTKDILTNIINSCPKINLESNTLARHLCNDTCVRWFCLNTGKQFNRPGADFTAHKS